MRARQARRGRVGVGLVVLGLLVVGASGVTQALGLPDPDYKGRVFYEPDSAVSFRIERARGFAVFQSKLQVGCADGSYPVVTLRPMKLRFADANTFQGSRFSMSDNGVERYYKVRGHLLPGGKAQGTLWYFQNADDPAVGGATARTDCSPIVERPRWHAERAP